MRRLLIILTLLSLPLVSLADWQPESSNMGLGLGISMGTGGTYTPPAHGDSILIESGSYILNEGGGAILKE